MLLLLLQIHVIRNTTNETSPVGLCSLREAIAACCTSCAESNHCHFRIAFILGGKKKLLGECRKA